MKKILYLFLFILFLVPVYAISPGQGVECCDYLEAKAEYPNYRDPRFEGCHIIENLTEEKCATIQKEWSETQSDWDKQQQKDFEQHVKCCLSFIREEEIGSECEDFDLDSNICLTLTIELLDESEIQRQQEIFEQHVQCCISVVKGEEIGSGCEEFDLDEEYDSVTSLCEVLAAKYGEDQRGVFIPLVVVLAIIAIWWLISHRKKKRKK